MSHIDTLEARKAEIEAELETIVAGAEAETRSVSDDEQTKLDELTTEFRSVVSKIEKAHEVEEIRAARAAALPAEVRAPATAELRTAPYAKGGSESYVKDLYLAQVKGERSAIDRLVVNDKHRAANESRAMSTTAGAGGEFAPPLWQIQDFVEYLRPGRPTANLLNHEVLPAGISSINLPKVTTGALTGTQSSQNTAVANRDFATGSVSTGISTIAGQVVISQQDIDQTPINLDTIVLQDLANDYAYQLNAAVISGIAGVSGVNAITYTDATPSSAKVLGAVQQGIDQIHNGVYRPAEAIVMRPDRWGRLLAATDSAGRPLVLPVAEYGAFNAAGIGNGVVPQGIVGTLRGVPVVLDASVPTNLGAGTNQDEIFVLRPSEINLYESAPKAEVFQQTYANQLSVLVRFYAYYGLIANRLPKAISVISGTGMIPGNYGN
jgi:HK97 family phage major capsid protein